MCPSFDFVDIFQLESSGNRALRLTAELAKEHAGHLKYHGGQQLGHLKYHGSRTFRFAGAAGGGEDEEDGDDWSRGDSLSLEREMRGSSNEPRRADRDQGVV